MLDAQQQWLTLQRSLLDEWFEDASRVLPHVNGAVPGSTPM
jgi:hypothetical protein